MPRKDLIQLRRGSAAQWAAANPTLAAGEPGYDETNDVIVIGDGATAWNDATTGMRYLSEAGVLELGGSGRELAYAASTAPQTGITTVVDVTNCSIEFEVGDRPVYVIGKLGQVYALTNTAIARLDMTDAANTVTRSGALSLAVTDNGQIEVIERIDTPGTYTRKLRVLRFSGTGNVNLNSATEFAASIRAIEA